METFEQAVDLVARFGEKFLSLLEQIRTRERAAAVLDQLPDFPPKTSRWRSQPLGCCRSSWE